MTTVTQLREHYRLAEGLWNAFVARAGDPGDDIRLLAAMPPRAIAVACEAAEILPEGEPLTAMQATHVGLVYRLARRICWINSGGEWQEWVDPNPWETTRGDNEKKPVEEPVETQKTRKLKLSNILDQMDDSEFMVEPEGGQTEMAEEIQGDHGGISPGRGGADAGTSIGDQEEGGWRSSTFCGLLHLCALRKAGNEDSQVQELPVRSFDGGLHGKGTPGAKFLRDVALVLQSLQGFFGDAGLGGIHHLEPLREPHGKTVEDVRRGLAFAGNGRREGQRRAIVKSEVEDCNRPGRRKGRTSGMVGEEAVELRPVVGAGGREVLERASSHTRLGLVGYGGKRLAPDPRREVHAGHSFGRQEPRRSPERVGEHGGRKWKKEIEQRREGRLERRGLDPKGRS